MSAKTSKLHIVVCDAVAADLDNTVELTTALLQEDDTEPEIRCYSSGEALLTAEDEVKDADVIFLDTALEDMDGILLAAKLRQRRVDAVIVFISADIASAMRGYEVQASRFLCKPLEREKLREALRFCLRRISQNTDLLIPTQDGLRRIPLADIICVESRGRGVCLTLVGEKVAAGLKISKLAEELPATQFIFSHRTVLVNLAYVERVRKTELEMKTGERLPISRYRYTSFKESFVRFLKK